MHYAMSIDILEVHKSKKYYMLIFDPFVNGVKLPKVYSVLDFNFFLNIVYIFVKKKTEGRACHG